MTYGIGKCLCNGLRFVFELCPRLTCLARSNSFQDLNLWSLTLSGISPPPDELPNEILSRFFGRPVRICQKWGDVRGPGKKAPMKGLGYEKSTTVSPFTPFSLGNSTQDSSARSGSFISAGLCRHLSSSPDISSNSAIHFRLYHRIHRHPRSNRIRAGLQLFNP